MTLWIGPEEMEDLALGAAVLGTGGGGDPYLGKLMAQKVLRERGPVRIISVDELDDDAFVATTSMMGAPTVMFEKIPGGDECLKALRKLESFLGKRADALIPGECGGLNSTMPIIVAALTGLPVIDGDGMGRAFPEMQQDTFNLFGVLASPCVLMNERGDCCIVETSDNNQLEWIARGITVRFGGVAHIATHPMSGGACKQSCVRGSLTLALGIGRVLREARRAKCDPFRALEAFTASASFGPSRILFAGKVAGVERRTEGGFTLGSLRIQGSEEFQGMAMAIAFQNENLIAYHDNRPVAMVPDLITVMDYDTAIPFTTETVRYGARVRVVGMPAAPIMRSEAGLALWGPRCFGYDLDYVPIEELHGGRAS